MEARQQFYVLENPRPGSLADKIGGTIAMQEESSRVGDAPCCPRCGGFIGMLPLLPPYRIELETWGRKFGDIIQLANNDFLVSDRFRQIYDKHGLKGFLNFVPVEVFKVKRHRKLASNLPQYFKSSVFRRSRMVVDQESSGFDWEDDEPVCPECLWKKSSGTLRGYNGIIIKHGSWTGEDVFYPRGSPANTIVSSRFRDICVENEVTNCVFLPAETYAWHKRDGEP